jgi:hypothetical protein
VTCNTVPNRAAAIVHHRFEGLFFARASNRAKQRA